MAVILMRKKPSIESHPDFIEIRRAIIEDKLTQEEVAAKYKITRAAVRWYADVKLKPELDAMKKDLEEKKVSSTIDTLTVLDKIIEKWPEAVEATTLNQILKALELRARITGEDSAPPRIEIVWGKGLGERPDMGKGVGDAEQESDSA